MTDSDVKRGYDHSYWANATVSAVIDTLTPHQLTQIGVGPYVTIRNTPGHIASATCVSVATYVTIWAGRGVTPTGKGRALGALVIGGVFLGCSPILVRLSQIGPIATAFWRLALALVPLVMLFGRDSRRANAGPMPASPRDYVTAALPGVF